MPSPSTGSIFSIFSPSGNAGIDALLQGTRWGPTSLSSSLTISYSFPTNASYWSTDGQTGYGPATGWEEPWNNLLALTPAQQAAVVNIFAMISTFTNLKFTQVQESASAVGDIRLAFSDAVDGDAAAWAYSPSGSYNTSTLQGSSYAYAGDVWVNADNYNGFSAALGTYDNLTLLHEIGHALGLKHTFEAHGSFGAIAAEYDSYDHSVMSYSALQGDQSSTLSYYPTTLMSYDVAALQFLYGKNTGYNASDTTYTFYANQNYNQVIWDAGGTDTIVYESTSGACNIDLKEGSWLALGQPLTYYASWGSNLDDVTSAYTIQILAGVTLENATGGQGADTLAGNAVANKLLGRGGNDTLMGLGGNDILNGGAGADSMTGGLNNDTYYVDNKGDVVREASAGGTDLVNSYLSAYTLGANVENGRIVTTSTTSLTGNTLANVLYAGAGSNAINGGLGTDTVSYQYAGTAVTASLATTAVQATGGSGSDTLVSIENLIGSAYADKLTGNTGANALNGGAGNDLLTGGLGADKLTGGTGTDRFDFNALAEMGLISTTRDTITDFKTSEGDKIDLLGVDANTALTGNQAFTYLGAVSAFTGNATGQLRFDATAHILYGSTDADTAAEFAIVLTGVSSLASADLVQ